MTQPKLRFAQFDGDWNTQKLEHLASFSKGNGYSKSDLVEFGTPIILYGSLYTDYQTAIHTTRTFVKQKEKSVISTGNEVIVPASGETAQDIARASAVINPNIILGGDLNIIKPNQQINNIFLALTLSCGRLQKELSAKAQGKSVVHLRNNDLKKLDIFYPTLAEQTTIGNFFRQVDKLIALHQGKLDNIKTLKKGLLQKMFPKQGETVPQIRFPQFTDAWEQRKLGEISIKVKEKNKNKEFTETLTNSAEFGVVSQKEFFDKEISNIDNIDNYYIVQQNDFIYNPRISNLAPVGPIKRNKLGRTGVMSPLYYVFRLNSDVEPSYLEVYFETKIWHKFMYLNGDTGARSDRFAIKDNIFVQMPIMLPSIAEQTTIGHFFRQLDKLITLHQRKLGHLKTLKKALLQQMFV